MWKRTGLFLSSAGCRGVCCGDIMDESGSRQPTRWFHIGKAEAMRQNGNGYFFRPGLGTHHETDPELYSGYTYFNG